MKPHIGRVKPLKGPVFDPGTGGLLRKSGRVVEFDAYWAQRSESGEVSWTPPAPEDKPDALAEPAAALPDATPEVPESDTDLSAIAWADLSALAKSYRIKTLGRARSEIEQDIDAAIAADAAKE